MSQSDRTIIKLDVVPTMPVQGTKSKPYKMVAAYARVSTGHEDQQNSFEAQVDYYNKMIAEHVDWQLVKIYSDEGISGCNTRHRVGFNTMMDDCEAGKIDLILTKSVSRFARNTVDSVSAIRKLKSMGIGVYFEKEAIWTLDSKGEFLITLMSSLAQEESRSISENVQWGQRKRFADGKSSLAYSRFLGYDKGPNKYEMVVNEEQALTVKKVFRLFLQGYTPHTIANIMTADSEKSASGITNWNDRTVQYMLSNEKYKGDALLQKYFMVDYLQKKTKKNEGELPQYYVEGDHEPIIDPWLFDYVQTVLQNRLLIDSRYSGVGVLSTKVMCGKCGAYFGPRPWHSTSYNNLVWQCRKLYAGEQRCKTTNVYDSLLRHMLHSTARKLLVDRDVVNTVQSIIEKVIPEKAGQIDAFIKMYLTADIWTTASDLEDLSLIIKSIVINEDRIMDILWLDRQQEHCKIPNYSPRNGIEE